MERQDEDSERARPEREGWLAARCSGELPGPFGLRLMLRPRSLHSVQTEVDDLRKDVRNMKATIVAMACQKQQDFEGLRAEVWRSCWGAATTSKTSFSSTGERPVELCLSLCDAMFLFRFSGWTGHPCCGMGKAPLQQQSLHLPSLL